jgi:hypothetical protein
VVAGTHTRACEHVHVNSEATRDRQGGRWATCWAMGGDHVGPPASGGLAVAVREGAAAPPTPARLMTDDGLCVVCAVYSHRPRSRKRWTGGGRRLRGQSSG